MRRSIDATWPEPLPSGAAVGTAGSNSAAPVSAPGTPRAAPVTLLRSLPRFQQLVNHSFVPLAVSSQRSHDFHASVRSASSPELSIVELAADAHVVERTRRLCDTGDDEPSYKVSLMIEGSGLFIQDGRHATLQAGDFAIYDTSRPYTLAFDHRFRTIVAMFPKRLLELAPERVGTLTATAFSRSDPVGSMVGTMLGQMAGRLDRVGATTGWRLARNAVDLVSILLNDELEDASAQPADGLRTAIRTYIEDHLDDPGLSPSGIAEAHYISVRYLHMLFRHEGVSVSAFVRHRRLERCRQALADPASAHLTVAAIAAQWAFADAAHFTRTFKAAYGVTPSEFRAELRGA